MTNKKRFAFMLEEITTRKKLDVNKIPNLSDADREEMVRYIVRNRGPIVRDLIPASMDMSWLHSCGYLHTSRGKDYTWIHTSEQKVK